MAQFIDKAAVVTEINRVLNSYDPNEITSGRYALANLRDFLDTLEVKEMDKNNEIVDKLHNIINFHKEKVFKGHWYNYMPEKISYHNGVISGIKQCLSIIRNR